MSNQQYKLSIGNSTIGYTTAIVSKSAAGKLKLVGDVKGHKYLVNNALSNINDNDNYAAITRAGDELPVVLTKLAI